MNNTLYTVGARNDKKGEKRYRSLDLENFVQVDTLMYASVMANKAQASKICASLTEQNINNGFSFKVLAHRQRE